MMQARGVKEGTRSAGGEARQQREPAAVRRCSGSCRRDPASGGRIRHRRPRIQCEGVKAATDLVERRPNPARDAASGVKA